MRTEAKKKRSGSIPTAFFLGIIFGILLVMTQELLYQYSLIARYETNAGNAVVIITEPNASTDTEIHILSNTPAVMEADKPSPPSESISFSEDFESQSAPDTAGNTETAGENVQTGPTAVYSYDEATGSTEIELDEFRITLNFSELRTRNPDFIGWLIIPNTNISFPVVQGADNGFYLKHSFDGTYSDIGSIFADYRSSVFNDENTIIYGHNWLKDTIMFSELVHYAEQEYYNAHPCIYFLSEESVYRVDIFSVYETPTTDEVYTLTFVTGDDYSAFLEHLTSMSAIETDTAVSVEDKVVTLSTCSNTNSSGRFVVIGKLIKLALADG